MNLTQEEWVKLNRAVNELQAERDRYRAALEEIAKPALGPETWEATARWRRQVAHEALCSPASTERSPSGKEK